MVKWIIIIISTYLLIFFLSIYKNILLSITLVNLIKLFRNKCVDSKSYTRIPIRRRPRGSRSALRRPALDNITGSFNIFRKSPHSLILNLCLSSITNLLWNIVLYYAKNQHVLIAFYHRRSRDAHDINWKTIIYIIYTSFVWLTIKYFEWSTTGPTSQSQYCNIISDH